MKKITWIKNGRIVDPKAQRDEVSDLFIVGRKIANRPSDEDLKTAKIIDAAGLVVCPGFVDLHAHFRVPGQTHKETIFTGTCSAAAGGFTSVVCMPNTSPTADSPGTIQYIKDAIKREAVVNVFPTGCITKGSLGEGLSPTGSLSAAGVVAISEGGKCIQNNSLMLRAVQYAKMFGITVIDHCEDYALSEGSVMNEGFVSTKLGLRGVPNAAEDIVVSRNVIFASSTGAHIHLQHISSGTAVEIIRRAKARGINITAEATPHHISLTEEEVESFNPNFKVNPPLRSDEDRLAIIKGLEDGTIDCIATGHAPHIDYEKDVEFDRAPYGVIGLETALSVVLEELHFTKRLSLSGTLSLLTHRASEILNLNKGTLDVGTEADVTLFDLTEKWTPKDKAFFSKSSNSPWLGRELTGKVKKTFVAGHLVFENDKILSTDQD